ncbi:hypothetical protein LCGC14_1115550 [marine sediment metagenome]|uniref:Uncharacterized protein n=1 Tax=marine sediment metagenome TaxID=412755 RepID=A0A0F9M5D2_9ZZZZ
MNKILITGDVENIANMTVSDKEFVTITYYNGRQVKYLYNPHYDIDTEGKTVSDRLREKAPYKGTTK